ncbi:MAG TPA: vanadium-dependent haloperoxidase [Streptosporangiaceae bacterium]|nr:vanadium-dependent haloperoxidase [Streptosporangiaceae bacterium]
MESSPVSADSMERSARSTQIRRRAADVASRLDGEFPRPSNGDEERYPSRVGNFSKGLPHNELGEVDPDAYDALLRALLSGDFAAFEALPLGGRQKLLNPLGGLAFNIEGPDSPSIVTTPPPAFASADMAAQMAELYWMAVCRDVPLSAYENDPVVAAAVRDLADFPGYQGPRPVTPQSLFRADYPGALDGPMVSQFLLRPFRYDGIPIEARTRVPLPVINGEGIDFLTYYDEWLAAQRGFPEKDNQFGYEVIEPGQAIFDPVPRFPRSVRDLGQNAGQDTINSAYFRAVLTVDRLNGGAEQRLLNAMDITNPYQRSKTQRGFATFGSAHLVTLLGSVHKAERHTWYLKWNMHRYQRPEVFAGRVHNTKAGEVAYPIHPRLLESPVLDAVWEYNELVNRRRGTGRKGSYLLPILFPTGSPNHPSFPAGHAISAGACVTILKAWFDEDAVIPNPVQPNADGTALEPYEGAPLTVGGELNKLCHNLSMGRDMSGVHWRADDVEGNRQGEELAVRILREARATYPEPFAGFTLTTFDNKRITI